MAKATNGKKNAVNNNGNPPEVNWLAHWRESVKVPEGVTKQKLKKVVRNYLNSWLAAQNLFQTQKKKQFSLLKLYVDLKPGSKRSYLISATLKPSAIPIQTTGDNDNDPDGGGHMIPHNPPPPPPRDEEL